jgi:hypothetical protein
MRASLWAGIYSTDPFGDFSIPQYYCASGNCTWNEYSSLGICNKCSDISKKLTISCNSHASDLNNVTGCDISLPNGFALGGPEGRRNHVLAASTSFAPLVYGNYSAPLAIIQTIAGYNTLFVNKSTSINASECVITPCIINYNQSILSTTPDLATYGYNGIPFYEYVDSIIDNYSFNVSAFPWNGPNLKLTGDTAKGRPSAYQMSEPDFTALKYYLQSVFSGYVITDGTSLSYSGDNVTRPVSTNSADAMQALYLPFPYGCYDRFGNTMYDSAVCTIEMASWAMTTNIRSNLFNSTDFNTNFAIGQTLLPISIIDVSWLWIIPVIALWLFCTILALATLWRSHRAGVQGMALNPLTFIFLNLENQHPLPEWWKSENARKELAEQTQVRLSFKNHKASLVQAP